MAEKEVPELDVGHYEEDAVSNFEERGVDVEGLGETKPTPSPKEQTPDTISQFSQFSVDEPDGKSTGKKKKKLKVVRDGLLLSLKGQKQAFMSFSYGLTPLWDSPSKVDWRVLTSDSLECMHVYVHQLVPGDTLRAIAIKHKKSCTDAVILVNVDDSLSIPPVYCEKLPAAQKVKKNSLPMIVISAEDGLHVRELLNQHETGDLLARIESKSQTHVEKADVLAAGIADLPKLTPKKPSGIRASMRRLTKGNQGLKEEVKALMFSPIGGPATVSTDDALFQHIMSLFYQHEQTVLRKDGGRHEDRSAVFRKLSKHLDDLFAKDFPFYLVLAYRVYKKEGVYQCDEMTAFVRSCIDRYEKLDTAVICNTLEYFFKMDNFKVMFSSMEELTVFKLLELACVELMNLSFQYKSQEGAQANYRSVFCRMLWVSVAYKCCEYRAVSSRETPNYWQDHLITAESFTHLGTDTIQSIKRGVEFGRLLQLPDELCFSSHHMGDVLTANNTTIRPFQRMREFVIILEPFVQLETEFIDCFMTHPRTLIYEPLFAAKDKIWVKSINSDGNLLAVLQEGVAFLDTVLEVGRKRQWLSDGLEEEIKAWLSFMLFTVDITSDKAESYLKTFLSSKINSVTKLYSEHIKRAVIIRIQENFNILSVEHFLRLYKAFLIWPTWVVEKYLKQYKIPVEVKICSPTWNEFFSEFVERFKDPQHHKFLLDFLKSVSKCYLEQERAKDFVLDLLALDVPDLFQMEAGDESTISINSDILACCMSDEFTAFLTDFIHRNQLQEALLEETDKIWNQISESSHFQQLVLNVLQQELIPETLTQQMTSPLRQLLGTCVKSICQNLDSLDNLTPRLEFCWGVVGSCCGKMPVTESLDWAKIYYHVIDQLGKIYSVYKQQQAAASEGGSKVELSDNALPANIASSSCEGAKKFFKWLVKAQQVLKAWMDKFTSKKVNYDSIKLYLDVYGLLNRAATSLSAHTLVVDSNYIHAVKTDFEQAYELLNITLLRYIPGHPDAGYLSLIEMLTKYGVGLPPETLATIRKNVSFPGETKSTGKKAASMEYSIPCSISSNFNPELNIKLELTRDIDFHGLKVLVRQLTSFLSPVDDNLNFLTFFYLNSSEIFDKYLTHQLHLLDEESAKPPASVPTSPKSLLPQLRVEKKKDPAVVAVNLLGKALENTKEFMLRLIQGNAMYTEIVANGSLNLRDMKIDVEFGILNGYAEWAKIDMQNAEGLYGIQAMVQLFQYAQHIKIINNVCEQYRLEACLKDGDLKELMELAIMLDEAETENKLTAKDAIEKMKRVTELLCLDSRQNHRFLDLFVAVSDSANFHQFIVYEKKFVEEGGRELFDQQYKLITTQLQHEEYQEVVLNHLYAAFHMITPFTQKNISFSRLMAKVAELNAYDGRRQLDTVNRNINLIRLWFSRAEGDTVQGVASELSCVLETGWYCFHFRSSVDFVSGAVQLRYSPHTYQNVEEAKESEPIVWNEEHIEDFVRKLGFLDTDGDSASQIRLFLHHNQSAKKLLEICTKHRELGHPEYLSDDIKYTLHCCFSKEEADEMVFNASNSLAEWQMMVTSLRSEYEQLLYFSIPKLLHLYHNLMAETPNVGKIVNDVGILFQNKHSIKKQLKKTVKELVRTKPHLFGVQIHSSITPMHQVGSFLAALFKDSKLSTSSLKQRRVLSPFSRSMSQQSTHILHACQNFTASQLVRTVIGIFGGVPEPFEVFHCRPTVTEEELRLFLNPTRATKNPFQFVILEVNKLPYHLQETLLRIHYDLKQQQMQGEIDVPCTHFLETGSSLLREMPWVLQKDYQGSEPDLGFDEASSVCKEAALHPEDFKFIQLVYGEAGDGKTHYIENELSKVPYYKKIAVNEAFTPLAAIKKLADLPADIPNCAIYFNFTLLPPGESVDDQERQRYNHLINAVGWFFFDLFILGYVEDPLTGHSFRCPGGMEWAIYVEVPSRIKMNSEMCLKEFYDDVPALGLLGTPHEVHPDTPYVVDEEVQLVCKYLKAYKVFKSGSSKGINKLFKEGGLMSARSKGPIKFSTDLDLNTSECYSLLDDFTPHHMKKNKASLKLFIRYMKRRCEFLDNCPAFNFNPGATEYLKSDDKKAKKKMNDTSQLGSTLMETMLSEVSDFCDPFIRENWSLKPHHQLIYDFKDGGGTFGLLSLHPDSIDFTVKEKFMKMGIEIPSMLDLYSRDWLDSYLSRALDVPLENGRLAPIDEYKYVLTLDFAIKMLNIHERAQCGVPVIIEGETGVGKTALIEMLSRLWNYSLIKNCNLYKSRLMDRIKEHLESLSDACIDSSPNCADAMTTVKVGKPLSEEDMILLGEIKCDGGSQFASVLRAELLEAIGDPMLSMMELREEDKDPSGVSSLPMLVASVKFKNNPKEVAKVLYRLLNCDVKNFFYKLNVHAALLPEQIISFFEPIFNSAKELDRAYKKFSSQIKAPFITVFLDEVNTSSCLGLFKEIIVDRTIDGRPIPDNIFVIGACNPHRGNSLATVVKKETWIRGTYYVRQLHPTLQCLMWDYGALGEKQEGDYISAKMRMSSDSSTASEQANLADLILQSQNLMREYANEQLQDCGFADSEASECSRSCVSQRDIQRVFTFYEWLYKMYLKYKPVGKDRDYSLRALLVSLGLVYYLRLDTKYRQRYSQTIDHQVASYKESFLRTFREELNWYIERIDLPDGIAKTQALKENLFATIVCTMTHTPLIIVGQPGSSKTLSFNLALANLKGQESKIGLFRNTDIFKSLDPHFYQCSRHTTSNEIQTVFSRAITRQRSHQRVPLPVYCVVFMDEAGLPEERHESLKVLHFYLDSPEVSFVAISNHVLDAAKTNRAVSLFRPDVTQEDLKILARGCICHTPDKPPMELKRDMGIISNLVPAYEALMRKEKFSKFFGLRDFIHFISFLKRKRKEMLSPQLVMHALERNFNGMDKKSFDFVTKLFLSHMHADPREVESTNILDILLNSILDHPEDSGAENEMRYKLIIDCSEDGLLVRLLFSSGVLLRDKTKIYMCSDFPGDMELQKVNTISAIRHSATEGHTVVMCQTDSIHESFYDLFNRRFHRIDANTGPRYFSNIAIGAHIKPCRVHEDFECIVVVRESDLETVPQPFLNRFEKYRLSHDIVLEATLSSMPPALAEMLRAVMRKTHEFLEHTGHSSSVYGLHKDTVSSLLLTMLPPLSHEYKHNLKTPDKKTPAYEVRNRIMELTLQALKLNAGFLLPECSSEELEQDMREVLNQVLRDAEFAGRILRMTSETYYNSTEDIYNAVMEAFDDLHHPHPERDIHQDVSINALLVVSAVTQILVRCLCKRLMQLMTSDSLCLHHRKIPASYIQNYLNYQNHFSLKKLVETHKSFLQHKTNPNKLICYTRSSQLLHKLPLQYPIPVHHPISDEGVSVLKELVIENPEELVYQKLSTFTSFTSISEVLKTFAENPKKSVALITVNMQETSRDVVNHLRVLIEEVEGRVKKDSPRKLFVLVLYFPATHFSVPCYSSLFLQGWDFTYLDMIGFSSQGGALLDIREWFKQCYTKTPFASTRRSINTQLNALLHEAIPVVSSRVMFGRHPSSSFNKPMNVSERNGMLKKLFFEKNIGSILCERFHSYWEPNIMVEYLEKAAQLSQQHDSSLSVIDSLQNIFKNLFFDFLVHMVHKMNTGMNVDVLFNDDTSDDVITLFQEILRTIPIPKLNEIKMLGITSGNSRHEIDRENFAPPKFPFFHLIASSVEKMVDQSRRDVNQSLDMLGEHCEPRASLFQTPEQGRVQIMADMLKIIQTKLEDMDKAEQKTFISLTIDALKTSSNLWQKYLEDFTRQKLRLEFGNTGISNKIYHAAFGKLEKRTAIQRLALLHVYVHMHKVNLAKVVSILRPLDQIEVAVSNLPSFQSLPVSSPTPVFEADSGNDDILESSEALSMFIINSLFNAISGIGMSCSSSLNPHVGKQEEQEIKVWFQAYRDMISMPALKEHIYSSRSETAEAQHSIMHALFLLIRSKPNMCSENLQLGLKIFNRLFDDNFKINMELQRQEAPRLGEIVAVILEELRNSSTRYDVETDPAQIRHIVEGLLAHFFSSHLSSYNTADVTWLLEMANRQTHWQATYLMSTIVEVEYSTDLLSKAEEVEEEASTVTDISSPHKLFVHIPKSVFKLYLHRILLASFRSRDDPVDPVHSIMSYFQKTDVHSLIANVLLSNSQTSEEEQKIGPYIPTFYQFCDTVSQCPSAENATMQQPLAHLYFLTVLEDLLTSKFGLPNLIRTSQRIAKQCRSAVLPEDQLMILHIEEQAMVQVVIKEVASHLDMKDTSKINTLFAILDDLNHILDDDTMGGGTVGGHGLVLAMHMLKEQQSFNRFTLLLTNHFSHLCEGINCLQPFHKSLTQAPNVPVFRAELTPVMLELGPEFQNLYQRITSAMSNIQSTHGTTAKTKELTKILDECSSSSAVFPVVTTTGRQTSMKKLACFKMALWLAAYNEFFVKGRDAPDLATVVSTLNKKVEPVVLELICCFLHPARMIREKREESEQSGQPESPHQTRPDPLYHLFFPLAPNQDLSDCNLRTALVHLVAVAIGCGRSTHLWYSIFQPSDLMNTYITGFMYDSMVGPSTQFYDTGVELTPEGLYGHHDYLKHATRGTLSLHSLYLLLWSNFASFSVSLLTQTGAESSISGKLLSKTEPAREFCVAQMKKLWVLLGTGLGLSEEEKLLLVNSSLNNLLECNLNASSSSGLSGKLVTKESLNAYETFWHGFVFTPAWDSLKEKFSSTSPFLKLNIIKDIMNMNLRYPWFPSEQSLTMAILSNSAVADPSEELYPLSRFVLEYPRLKGGMELLPGIVELYQYLHTELTYAITYKEVTTITLRRLARVISKHFVVNGDRKAHYEKLKSSFNKYVQLTGCTKYKRPVTVGDDTPLVHLLSYSVDGEQGSDLLYTVISDIITFLNKFVASLMTTLESSEFCRGYFPDTIPHVHVMEFTQHYIFTRSTQRRNNLLQLILGRSHLPMAFPTDPSGSSTPCLHSCLPGQLGPLVNLQTLQEDILVTWLAGMPIIDQTSVSSLRLPFKFKDDGSMQFSVRDHTYDLETIAEKLPEEFKYQLDEASRKRLEYEFHSACYHTVMEVLAGLRTSISHLIKEVTSIEFDPKKSSLRTKSLPAYLIGLFEYDPQDDSKDVFHEIGIHGVTQTQHDCLASLSLLQLYSTLRMFVMWAEDGWYDFCSLPYGVKLPMDVRDEETISEIPNKYSGSPVQLVEGLKQLSDVLIHMETSIVKAATEKSKTQLVRYLKRFQLLGSDKVINMFPSTIYLENYVALRVAIRKLTVVVQAEVSRSGMATPEQQLSEEKWCDLIDDLWEHHLPYFRIRGYVVTSRPPTSSSFTGNADPSSTILTELTRSDSDQNMLETLKREAAQQQPLSPPPTSKATEEKNLALLKQLTSQVKVEEMQRRAKDVSPAGVLEFLDRWNLGCYKETFEEMEISGELLIVFQDKELQEIGIESALDRLRIITYFKRLVAKSSNPIAERYPVETVYQFLDETKPFQQFATSFKDQGIDGELLLNASDEVMKELGVTTGVHRLMLRQKFKAKVDSD